MRRLDLSVGDERQGQTLAAVLAAELGDAARARGLIEAGAVFVNGRRTRDLQKRLPRGAHLVVHVGQQVPSTPLPEPRVIYEDGEVIVLDKRPGEHLNETETSSKLALVEMLRRRIPEVRVVHRLDRETSGVVLLAKTAREAERLSEAFRERRVEKRYLAIVEGALPDGLIDAPIGPDPRRPRARRVVASGQAAATRVVTMAKAHGLSLVAAELLTGRTHQIRVHLSHRGAPILGDRLYGGPVAVRVEGEVLRLERTMLHAAVLAIPLLAGVRRFEAPLPPDFEQFLRLGLG